MKFRSRKYANFSTLAIIRHHMGSSGRGVNGKLLGQNYSKLSMKKRAVLSVTIILIILVSVFAFMPKQIQSNPIVPANTDSPTAPPTATPKSTNQPIPSDPFSQVTRIISGIPDTIVQAIAPKSPGIIETASGMNSTVWRQVAQTAWQYFQPGLGVDSNTGLPSSGIGVPYFTDWDLGAYIQAVMDANATAVIGSDGDWGSSARLEKVVHWLETRDLNSAGYPFWFYQSKDGKNYRADSDLSTVPVDTVDTGRLFVALNNLRNFNSSLAARINNIVLYGQNSNRSNYAALVPSVYQDSLSSTSTYAYYVESGFASFWPDQLSSVPGRILSNILSSPTTTTNNVTLPISSILGDPLVCSVFELNKSPQLMTIMRQVYLAHEAYYNATGVYRAFSEGASLSNHWTYEWVVLPDNRTWVILDEKYQPFNISPIIYTKIAMAFLAMYNTSYAYNMNVYLEKVLPAPSNGYCEGVTEDGAQLTGTGSNTNGLVLGAAKYALLNSPQ